METENVRMLYFSRKAGGSAKVHWWSRVNLPLMEIGMGGEGKMLCCPVPEYYWKNRGWEEERLTDCLNKLMHQVECEQYYLQPEVAGMVGIEEKLPPEILLRRLLHQVPCMEYLCCIGWEEEQPLLEELLEPFLPRVNHINMVTDNPQAYDRFAEYVYGEYGIPLGSAPKLGRNLGRDGRTVILDLKRDYGIPWQAFPKETIYVDFWSAREKRQLLEKYRRDAKYLSVVKFLDTIVKSGYNTRVNQTKTEIGKR